MKFLNALDASRYHIKLLYWMICFLVIIVLGLIWVLSASQAVHRVYLVNAPSKPTMVSTDTYSRAFVYDFALTAWQRLNYWQNNGEKDYFNNIARNRYLLTPRFYKQLTHDATERLGRGELQDRIRSLQSLNGEGFKVSDVKRLSKGTWLVYLNMRLTERMNINAKVIKDIETTYVLRVTRYDVGNTENPYGLALDGFSMKPVRVKDFANKDKENKHV